MKLLAVSAKAKLILRKVNPFSSSCKPLRVGSSGTGQPNHLAVVSETGQCYDACQSQNTPHDDSVSSLLASAIKSRRAIVLSLS